MVTNYMLMLKEKRHRQQILELKEYRQRRKRRRCRETIRLSRKFDCTFRSFIPKFIQVLSSSQFVRQEHVKTTIIAPKFFSFKKDYNGSLLFFKELVSTYYLGNGAVNVSFEKCIFSSIANFSLLSVVIHNLEVTRSKYNYAKFEKCNKIFKFKRSLKDVKTNKYLHNYVGLKLPIEQDDGSQYLNMPLQYGKQRNYKENPKTRLSSYVVDFVNKSISAIGFELNTKGIRNLGRMMGEVLGNAEDHSAPNSYWYVDAISFLEKQEETDVVELNLTIINVGQSMYEGFEATKKSNFENYRKCQELYNIHKEQFSTLNKFEKESLFTMYLLDDGISRLKYKDESRGNGTMHFLESFISLGSFGIDNPNFKCQLNVISGHTILTCDNDMHAFKHKTTNVLSLNKEKDFKKLPNKKYLSYNEEYFPGTILECHLYLNEQYFKEKIETN